MESYYIPAKVTFGTGEMCALIKSHDPNLSEVRQKHDTLDVWLRCRFPDREYECNAIVDIKEVARQQRIDLAHEISKDPSGFSKLFGVYLFKKIHAVVGVSPFYSSNEKYTWLQEKIGFDPRERLPCVKSQYLEFISVLMDCVFKQERENRVVFAKVSLDELYVDVEELASWRSSWANQ